MEFPRKLGALTIVGPYDADAASGCFVGILDEPDGPLRVLARRIGTGERGSLALLRARVSDLRGPRHPSLAPVLELVEAEEECWVVEAWSRGVSLAEVVRKCAARGAALPNEVFLHLAIQLCTAVEALHGRHGANSDPTLHLELSPAAISVGADGHPALGRFGLLPIRWGSSPRPADPTGPGNEYLAPEQMVADVKLGPSTDVFSLGTVLYELLTFEPMFRAGQIRREDVMTQLVAVREALPGLDKVLARTLSANPAHRYQSAFVLREDLRGLMSGRSTADVERAAREFFAPMVHAAIRVWEEASADDAETATWVGPIGDFRCTPPEDTDPDWTTEVRGQEEPDLEQTATERIRMARTARLSEPAPEDDVDETVRIARSAVASRVAARSSGFPSLVRTDGDTWPIGTPAEEIHQLAPSPVGHPSVSRTKAPRTDTRTPQRSRPEDEDERVLSPSLWVAALVVALVIGMCLGVPSAGILSIVGLPVGGW